MGCGAELLKLGNKLQRLLSHTVCEGLETAELVWGAVIESGHLVCCSAIVRSLHTYEARLGQ